MISLAWHAALGFVRGTKSGGGGLPTLRPPDGDPHSLPIFHTGQHTAKAHEQALWRSGEECGIVPEAIYC